MARSVYNYLCIREDNTVEIIASQDISTILEEFDDYDNPFTSIIRQGFYNTWDKCLKTTWRD